MDIAINIGQFHRGGIDNVSFFFFKHVFVSMPRFNAEKSCVFTRPFKAQQIISINFQWVRFISTKGNIKQTTEKKHNFVFK